MKERYLVIAIQARVEHETDGTKESRQEEFLAKDNCI